MRYKSVAREDIHFSFTIMAVWKPLTIIINFKELLYNKCDISEISEL